MKDMKNVRDIYKKTTKTNDGIKDTVQNRNNNNNNNKRSKDSTKLRLSG